MAGHKQMDRVVMARLQKQLGHPPIPGMDGQRHWHISGGLSERVHVHVSSLFPMGSCSLGTAGSHHGCCGRGEEQQLWGKPHASQNTHLASEPRRLSSTYSNNALYHPTKGFPGNPFQTPR